jgi:hypothetical protein
MKSTLFVPIAAVLLTCGAQKAQALWRQCAVTPGNLVVDDHAFTVTSKLDEGRLRVLLTVKAQGKKPLSPFTTGMFWLHDGERLVAEIPVQEHREKGVLSFSFKIDPKVVADSRFELHESFFVKAGPEGSRFRFAVRDGYEQIMGGQIFTFKLSDFLPPAKK